MYHILLVEDDVDLSLIAATNLRHADHQVDTAFTCAQAEALLAEKSYDLILLDIMLPDRSGSDLCKTIRTVSETPIIFMSCLEDSETIIQALRNGGDDYMVKPINYSELLARAEAVIRRTEKKRQQPLLNFKSFSIDTLHHKILRGNEEIDLSSIEYAIVEYMAHYPDTLLLYQDIYQSIWESDSLGDFRTVMVHISNLRKKIDPEHKGIIQTVRGAGYIFSDN